MIKLLLIGGSGFLGSHFNRLFQSKYHIHNIIHQGTIEGIDKYTRLNLTEFEIDIDFQPDFVCYFAAISNPNTCEVNFQLSFNVNVLAAIKWANYAHNLNIPFLYTSTDLVFDGKKGNYSEFSQTNPLNVYGKHKLTFEQYALSHLPNCIIARLPLLAGNSINGRDSFIGPMLNALKLGNLVSVFTDEYRSVANVNDICLGISNLLKSKFRGIIHLPGPQRLSRFEIGVQLCDKFNLDTSLLNPCLQLSIQMPAARPSDCSMISQKGNELNWSPKDFKASLGDY
ncbi:MAG: SDR family oxidoreductase [Bacteroidota bacterium]|nr:SDR family oxidoreductase [Bacteroidota bacterium]